MFLWSKKMISFFPIHLIPPPLHDSVGGVRNTEIMALKSLSCQWTLMSVIEGQEVVEAELVNGEARTRKIL